MLLSIPAPPYTLLNASIPVCLLERDASEKELVVDGTGVALLDVAVGGDGVVAFVASAGSRAPLGVTVDCQKKVVFPTFADAHTHIDKGHTWARTPNVDGSRDGAFAAAALDATIYTPDDVRRRVEFSLQCAYAYGTSVLRTHVVTTASSAWVWPILVEVRERWSGRVDLQLVGMVVPFAAFLPGGFGDEMAALVARHGGLLGCSCSQPTAEGAAAAAAAAVEGALSKGFGSALGAAALAHQGAAHGGGRPDDFPAQIEALFDSAVRHNLDLDIHADENGDACADALLIISQAALRRGWAGRVTVGHCCALALADDALRSRTLAAAAAARVGIVSLPMCNAYLQDRAPGRTPRWRGVTLLHELKAAGVKVAVASDNTRDAFYAFGDLDMLETLRESTRMAHLDHPFVDWPAAAAKGAAELMGVGASHGAVGPGRKADLVIFRARTLNELLSRSQHDRLVVRAGAAISAAVPPYEDLDDLMLPPPGAHTPGAHSASPAGAPTKAPAMTAVGGAAGLVDLSLWETDRAACVAQVAEAARQTGFLQVYNHGIPQELIDSCFKASQGYFALPDEVKARTPFQGFQGGWEKEQQIRPSTGTADLKESFQIGYAAACQVSWPAEVDAPSFRSTCSAFMAAAAGLSDTLLRALALALDMPETALVEEHDTTAPDVQTVLRLLHYPAIAHRGQELADGGERWRAGAHTDFDVLTLIFQRPGEGGLELCPGRQACTEFACGDTWLPVPPAPGCVTCNIGDMLMRWSDDRVVSTFHRVRAPPLNSPESAKPRFSIAYFNQARAGTVIAGASGKYEPLTGAQFLQQAVARNFAALARQREAAAAAAGKA